MRTNTKVDLTSSEMGNLWSAYITDTMSICVLEYFMHCTKDPELLNLLDAVLAMTEQEIRGITSIYKREKHPIPIGFNENDVYLNAPPLYTENFFLNYVHSMCKVAMNTYAEYIATSTRADVLRVFTITYMKTRDICVQSLQLLLKKGLYSRPANLPIPKRVDTIKKQSYLTGWLGSQRPINALEISQLYYNIQRNGLGKALLLGFVQVAQLNKMKQYFHRGVDMARKNIRTWEQILEEENVDAPPTWDSYVLETDTPPFSDKLMMYHIVTIGGVSIGIYGTALGRMMRRDLSFHFLHVLFDALKYSEDGNNLLIEQGWLEQAPQAINHMHKNQTRG